MLLYEFVDLFYKPPTPGMCLYKSSPVLFWDDTCDLSEMIIKIWKVFKATVETDLGDILVVHHKQFTGMEVCVVMVS